MNDTKHVYMVRLDWSTTDDEGIETELFEKYEDACARFEEMIKNEKDPKLSWVGDQAFDEYGNVIEDEYELDCGCPLYNDTDKFWHIVDKNDWNRHSFIDLIRVEIR